MAVTRRSSVFQHYHVAVSTRRQRASEGNREGFFKYDQGKDGANAAARQMAYKKTREFGERGEVQRIGTGLWVAVKWNRPAHDYGRDGPEFDIVESVSYSKRVCFDRECSPAQDRAAS